MSDELVKQSIAELQDIVHCDCGSAYLERGRHSHVCLHYMADALKIVTDRIEELEERLGAAQNDAKEAEAYAGELEAVLESIKAKLVACEKYRDAYAECDRIGTQAVRDLEAKLAKAVEALSGVMVGGNHLALLLPDNFLPAETEPLDALDMMGAGDAYEVWCCWRSIMLARTALAELRSDLPVDKTRESQKGGGQQ